MAQQGSSASPPLSRLEQLERRTVEGSRLIRDNLHSVLRPLVQSGSETYLINNQVTLSNWIQGRTIPVTNVPSPSAGNSEESFVINVEDIGAPRPTRPMPEITPHQVPLTSTAGDLPSPAFEPAPNNTPPEQNNTPNLEHTPDVFNFPITPETALALSIVKTYAPFILILLSKTLYDYTPGILLFAGLTGTFIYSNNRLKQEIALHNQKNIGFLLFLIVQLVATICFYYYLYYDMKLYLSLVFIPPYVQPLAVADLLWLVGGNDFILRLMTIIIKVLVTLIPHRLFPAKRRGKWYVAIETTSQLYRSLVPIQPWLYYLLDSYQGPQKVVGVFLSAAYMVSKGTDLMTRVRAWWASIVKLLKAVQLGVVPTKEQIRQYGPHCPICHEIYNTPVLLSCRHIFCEDCLSHWFNSEQTCPMCRAKVFDDPAWRDGATTLFIQLF